MASNGSSSTGDGNGGLSNSGSNDSSHKLSNGAIAGIVVCSLLVLIAFLVMFIRNRLRKRRANRLNNWKGLSSSTYDFGNTSQSNGMVSQRSSFATSYDIATAPRSSVDLPEIPAMVEIRDTHAPGFLAHPQGMNAPAVLINLDNSTDNQVQSNVLVHPPPAMVAGNANLYLPPSPTSPTSRSSLSPSPMSVRPFSPSEMFSFPKPPRNSVSSSALLTPPAHVHEFSESEIVRRPFVPSLDDELAVEVGDIVTLLRVFPDGWALVEKVGNDNGKGKARALEAKIPGLIPVDCFRQAGLL